MKRVLSYTLVLATVLFLGSTNIYAGAVEDYLKDKTLNNQQYQINTWTNGSYYSNLDYEYSERDKMDGFSTIFKTENVLIKDVSNVTVISSDENIATATIKPYDFAAEEKYFEDYIAWYDTVTLEELNERNENKYQTKPTWWEYANDKNYDDTTKYQSEPQNWWEAYHLAVEPTNVVEVVVSFKDFGKVQFTLKADGKSDIQMDVQVSKSTYRNEEAIVLAEVITNYDKYKDVLPKLSYNDKEYNFVYEIKNNTDLSSVLNAMKGKNLVLLIQNYNYGAEEIFLNGNDIKEEVGKGFTYYNEQSMEKSVNKDKIAKLVDLTNPLYIDFAYTGKSPVPYKMNFYVENLISEPVYKQFFKENNCEIKEDMTEEEESKLYECVMKIEDLESKMENLQKQVEELLKNTTYTLLRFNEEKNAMEIVLENLKADENGKFEINLDYLAGYVLVANDNYKLKSNNAQTGTLNVMLYGILATFSLAGMAGILLKNKKNKSE